MGLRQERQFVYWVTQVVSIVLEHLNTLSATEIYIYKIPTEYQTRMQHCGNIYILHQREWLKKLGSVVRFSKASYYEDLLMKNRCFYIKIYIKSLDCPLVCK